MTECCIIQTAHRTWAFSILSQVPFHVWQAKEERNGSKLNNTLDCIKVMLLYEELPWIIDVVPNTRQYTQGIVVKKYLFFNWLILKLEALWTSEMWQSKDTGMPTIYIEFSIFTLSATKNEREMVVINCPIFTGTNLVSWLHKRGQLLQISTRNKKHKIKILFDVTSDEIWYKRGIHLSCLWTNRVGKIYNQECEIYIYIYIYIYICKIWGNQWSEKLQMNRNEIRDVYFYRLCYQNDAHIITGWCKIKMYISGKWNLMFRKMDP